MCQHGVVARLIEAVGRQPEARRENAVGVALLDEGADLVQGEEAVHAIAEAAHDMGGVGAERLGGVARFPAATRLQRLR
jgi:F0F1-type ATP synthase membrane subunit c/vacuolar-type H+-ATPase subunit K